MSGDFSTATYGTFRTGSIRLVSNNTSSNTTTGDLTVVGGVGIGGGLNVGGNINTNNLTITGTTASTSTTTGALIVTGGVGIGGGLYVGGSVTSTNLTLNGVTTSTNTTTGALIVTGGVGIGGNLYQAGILVVQNTATSTSTTTGALRVSGGVGIGGTIYIGPTTTSSVVTSFVSNNNAYTSYTSNTITNSIQVILDTFSTSTYRTAKYIVQIVDGANIHAQEILLFHNGSTVYKTEYAIVYNISELGSFDADVSGGLARLLFTASPTPTALTVKMVRIGLTL